MYTEQWWWRVMVNLLYTTPPTSSYFLKEKITVRSICQPTFINSTFYVMNKILLDQ
uniref:Uncharacterized protein n=1 Tax=Oryza brachyantha TaxID=4533 RepID=J3MEY7_ORYBR